MKIMFAFLTAILLMTVSCVSDSRPDANTALEYTATQFFTEIISQLHDAKDDARLKQILARRYYGNLFILWYGTHNPPTAREILFDLRGNVRAYLRVAKEFRFETLVDYDDPLGWNHLPSAPDREWLVSALSGDKYYSWVLVHTKDPASYKDAVRRFREMIATVKPGE
jgi:hypothetical protein